MTLKLAICSLLLLCGCASIEMPTPIAPTETPTEIVATETPTDITTTATITPTSTQTETPTPTLMPTQTPTLMTTFSLQRNAWGGIGRDPRDLALEVRRGELGEDEGYKMAIESGFKGTMREFLILKDSTKEENDD